jgi:spore coat polysaccharide biosynthesis predicted glycosyltransferase SpsG/RimJ/RimL family protein N-acetyltransferase
LRVKIFTEASKVIGLGHYCRCYAVYEAFKGKGICTELIVKCDDVNVENNVEKFDWISNFINVSAQMDQATICVIDSYLADKEVYKEFSRKAGLCVYIDDFNRFDYPKGLVLQGRMPLRTAFVGKQYIVKDKVKSIFVSTGGTDQFNIENLIKNIRNIDKSIKIYAVISNNKIENKDDNVIVKNNLNADQMAALMINCDCAVVSAGQTLNECLSIGIPTISFSIAENQVVNLEEAGNADAIIKVAENELQKRVKELIDNKQKREILNIKANEYIKKTNKNIIKQILIKYYKTGLLQIRNAELKDSDNILALSNEQSVRDVSIRTKSIDQKEHNIWYAKQLDDESVLFFVIELNNEFVGQIRYGIDGSKALISLSLFEKYRGLWISKEAYLLTLDSLKRKNVRQVIAKIKKSNMISIKFFESLGYIKVSSEFDILMLEKKIA